MAFATGIRLPAPYASHLVGVNATSMMTSNVSYISAYGGAPGPPPAYPGLSEYLSAVP